MAIVKMNKFTLLAFEYEKYSLLEKLQALENVQLVEFENDDMEDCTSLKKDNTSIEVSEVEGEISKVKFTINLLSEFAEKSNAIKSMKEGKKTFSYDILENRTKSSNWRNVYKDLLEKQEFINRNMNMIQNIKGNIEELLPWSNLDVPVNKVSSFREISGALGTVPSNFYDSLLIKLDEEVENYYIESVNSNGKDNSIIYLVHNDELNKAESVLKSYGFSKSNLKYEDIPNVAIKKYNEEISILEGNIKRTKEEIKNYVIFLDEMKLVYEFLNSKLLRLKATENIFKSENIIMLKGYYPKDMEDVFESKLKETLGEFYYLEVEEAQDDLTPVKLKNNSIFEAFEPITEMYSVPKYKEIDPTPLFAPFYIIFFGMMLSDAGYGFVMFIGTLIALKAFNLEGNMRKTIKMFFFLSISTMIWGALYGSYFGEELIKAIWMKPDMNVGLLMIVSVTMGLIQIYVGLGIKAYILIRDGDPWSALWDSGLWYITLTGSIIWVLSAFMPDLGIPNIIVTISKIMTLTGMVLIVLTHGRNEKSIGAKLGTGLYSLYGITSYVGDLVSYTRLAALGLATGFIGYAFNVMTQMVSSSLLTFIFGAIIFIVGHTFNLFINALGAYVHTMRLQYLEYFGKFYEGGGRAFQPLTYNSKYYKIVKVNNEEE